MLQSLGKNEKVSQYIGASVESFETELHEYLRDEVVKIIKTDGTWSVGSILNQGVAKELLNNILWWLFDGDPESSLLQLEELNSPQHICGKVFKSGEPTYSCRDCAMDPTCVFCQQCFRNSEHKKHRYKVNTDAGGGMCDCGDPEAFREFFRCSVHEERFASLGNSNKMHTSAGGGCCDCGDPEAWMKHPACTVHGNQEGDMDTDQDCVTRLPDVVRERAPHFFEALLRYAVDLLTNERTKVTELDESLQPSVIEDCHITMLFNDELHTFDYVIDILKRALKCDDATGSDFATVIDREGRSAVCIDEEKKCQEIKAIVSTRPAPPFFHFRTTDPLKTLLIHVNVVAHQEMALLILPWLSRIVQQSEGLRKIFCEVAMKEVIPVVPQESSSGSGFCSVIERFIRCDHELWKTARNLYQQLTMNSLLLDAETKKKLGVLFTRLYSVIQEGFMKGDHEHGQSVASLSVQLFTVPTISRFLIVEEDILRVILRFVTGSCCQNYEASGDWYQTLKLDSRKTKTNFRRMQYCFYDLKYILTNLPDQWTEELREKFVQGVQMFLQIFMAMQGMDAVTRKSDRHIEHEPEWETGVTLVMRFNPILHHILRWCETDQDLLFVVLKNCFVALNKIQSADVESMKLGTTTYRERTFSCIDYDITKQPVSTQFPVSRLTAALLVALGRFGIAWDDVENNIHVAQEFSATDSQLMQLLECPLRCLCLCAEVSAGMWRRNGLSLVNQLFYYKDTRCRREAFERDIQMLQICASKMDPDHFIALVLDKIKLNPEPEEFAEITERPAWEEILHEVADFKESTNINNAGKYELKQECFSEFCPFSYHFTNPTEETKAHNEIVRRKRALQLSTVFTPPRLPRFTDLFSRVPFLLCSDFFIQGMSLFLQTLTAERHELWTDRLVEKALYLIAMAVVETEHQLEMDADTEFNFIKKAVSGCESSILFLLKQLHVTEPLAIHRETLRWLISKIERLSNQRPGTSSSVDPEPVTQQTQQTSDNDNARNARKRKAQELRDKLLNQMKTMQQNFLSQNPDMMAEPAVEVPMEMSQESSISQEEDKPVCTELSWQLQATKNPEPTHTCILCQEETAASEGSIVMSALVQRSTVLTRGAREPLKPDERVTLFVDLAYPNAIHASTCSHAMHYECFKHFRESVIAAEQRRRIHRFSRKAFNVAKNEFLCPLCSRLSNTVIPVIPPILVAKERGIVKDDGSDQSPSTSVDVGPPTLKAWLKAVEEILAPTKHEKQEVVLKFHVDVTDLHEEMENTEPEQEPVLGAAGVDEEGAQGAEAPEEVGVPEEGEDVSPQGSPMSFASMEQSQSSEDGRALDETIQKLMKDEAPAEPEILPEGLRSALEDFAQMAQTVAFGDEMPEIHRPLEAWNATATTIICAEMVTRLDDTPVLAKSPVRLSAALDGVISSSVALAAISTEEMLSEIRKYARRLLSSLIGEDVKDPSHRGLLNTNIFTTFVSSWLSSAILRKSKLMKDHPILQENAEFEKHLLFVCTLAQIVQIFLFLDADQFKRHSTEAPEPSLEVSALRHACDQVRKYAGLPHLPSSVSEKDLTEVLNTSLQPFIRCCALFLHHATGVPAPLRLENSNHKGALMSYLGLPRNLIEFFDVSGQLSLDPLIKKWCTHPKVIERAKSLLTHLSFPTVSEVPSLVPFPHDYSDLIGSAATFKCPKFASEDSLCPTMCLVCGVILCSQSYCCQQPLPGAEQQQVGACTHHAHVCGAGGGMFLRVREAMIVLLHGVYRGCFLHAPYLDRYGETDKGLRRGNPLYLSEARLLDLRKLWLTHGVAEKVSHDIESKHMHHVLDWAHL